MLIRAILQSVGLSTPVTSVTCSISTREVVPVSSNVTASLAMRQSRRSLVPPGLSRAGMLDFDLKRIRDHGDAIEEHAARRADLLFYQMVALYGLNGKYGMPIQVKRGVTVLQHGKGSKLQLTQACHSALFPAITIAAKGAYRDVDLTASFKGTHLYQSLNSTVELPVPVNGFDDYIEGSGRPSSVMLACLDALNQVANDQVDPASGMALFYQAMHQFFTQSRADYFTRNGLHTSTLIKLAIDEFQRKGTFSGADAGLKMLDDYLFLLLRLKPNEIKQVKEDRALLKSHYQSVQDEIWSSGVVKSSGIR